MKNVEIISARNASNDDYLNLLKVVDNILETPGTLKSRVKNAPLAVHMFLQKYGNKLSSLYIFKGHLIEKLYG